MIELSFDRNTGLLPAIAQDAETGEVLMLAWVNREAFELTLSTGVAHYWSRSRKSIWKKGERSGNTQEIVGVWVDCDEDTVLYKVKQNGGAACHEGYSSCFYRRVNGDELEVNGTKIKNPEDMYGRK